MGCFYISNEGLQPEDSYKHRIIQFSVPQDVETLRSFLALCNYCGEFIPSLSMIAEPLQKLLRKGSFWKWGEENLIESFYSLGN